LLPWCIFGDFNNIMDASEKRGRTTRSNWLVNGFRQATIDSGLSDVPMEGYPLLGSRVWVLLELSKKG